MNMLNIAMFLNYEQIRKFGEILNKKNIVVKTASDFQMFNIPLFFFKIPIYFLEEMNFILQNKYLIKSESTL